MAHPVILNNDRHRNLRVAATRSAEYGDKIHIVPVIGDEISDLVLDFPVYLMENKETGKFNLYALMGLEPDENLYLQGDHWAANYVPLHLRRQPFLLAAPDETSQASPENEAKLAIDLDSKRIVESDGETLFNEDGSKTPYLESIIRVLAVLAMGIESTAAFIELLVKHDLIMPAQLNITFANGERQSLQGLHGINAEKLDALAGDALQELHSRGFLQACYLMVASMGQVGKLITMKDASR